MSGTTRLGAFCHARAGDKGDASILLLAPDDPVDFAALAGALTPALVARHFAIPDAAGVVIRPIAGLSALTIVLPDRLEGGVTRSATIDPHGKTLSSHLLLLELPTYALLRRDVAGREP